MIWTCRENGGGPNGEENCKFGCRRYEAEGWMNSVKGAWNKRSLSVNRG